MAAGQSADAMAAGLGRRLSADRDVQRAWLPFVPELTYGRHRMPPPPDARRAAVLMLLYSDAGEWRLPLIVRTRDMTVHSGQISLPGGSLEPGESPEAAAIRELHEELGVSDASIRLCGRLTTVYIYASNFVVTPCVAVTTVRPEYQPNSLEVASVVELPLTVLGDPRCRGSHEIRRRGLDFLAPHIEFQGWRVWGATSMMLAELNDAIPDPLRSVQSAQ